MKIDRFSGQYGWLSNFSTCRVVMPDGIEYPSVEHAYQAYKSKDPEQKKKIAKLRTAALAKREGRRLKVRDDWESIKLKVMFTALNRKFSADNPQFVENLLGTGNAELVEGNTWGDTYWGVCRGQGENNLGKLLMKIRDGLQSK